MLSTPHGLVLSAWLLAQPRVSSVISGATKLAQVESNARAAGWQLAPQEAGEVNAILEGQEG